jgi:hypothetical protein
VGIGYCVKRQMRNNLDRESITHRGGLAIYKCTGTWSKVVFGDA